MSSQRSGAAERAGYVPALGVRALTGIYDPVVALTTREGTFKRELLRELGPRAGERILDLGCGTGTLALMIKHSQPEAAMEGVDADPTVLARARRKSAKQGLPIRFHCALAQELPFEANVFDAVVTSLFLHHLARDQKMAAFAEVSRVLRPGGRLHIADWGRPSGRLMALASKPIRLLDGFAPTADNLAGRLPAMLAEAGFEEVHEGARIPTAFGTLALYNARVSEEAT
jgi:SAM-dependent methyltransferase